MRGIDMRDQYGLLFYGYNFCSRSWGVKDTNSQDLEFSGRHLFICHPSHFSRILKFSTPSDADFHQIDMYSRNIKQYDLHITPEVLVSRYLARPYKRDLHKLRAIFAWI